MSLFTANLKSAIQNAMFEVSMIPTTVELNVLASKYRRHPEKVIQEQHEKNIKREEKEKNKEAAKIVKEEQKKEKEESKKAQAQAKAENRANVPEEIYQAISDISKGNMNKIASYTKRYMEAQTVINYALRWISNENAELLTSITMEEKSIVNAVANLFGCPIPYKEIPIADLRKYDPMLGGEDWDPTVKFLIFVNAVNENRNNMILMKKIEKRREQLKEMEAAEAEHPEDDIPEETAMVPVAAEAVEEPVAEEDKPEETKEEEIPMDSIHKVNFVMEEAKTEPFSKPRFENEEVWKQNPDPEIPIKGNGISYEEFAILEPYMQNLQIPHRWEREADKGFLYLFVERGPMEFYYLVDDGSYLGTPAIICRCADYINNGWIFVPLFETEIVRKVLTESEYVLSEEEMKHIMDNYYLGINLNRYFDLSEASGCLGKATREEKLKFARKLDFIMARVADQTTQKPEGIDYPKFRIKDMKSLEDFTAISDSQVDTSLASFGGMNVSSNNICEGLTYMVEGDTIIQFYQDTSITYTVLDDGTRITHYKVSSTKSN